MADRDSESPDETASKKTPITVHLSETDRAKLKRRADALKSSESGFARMLILDGLRPGRAGDAAKAALDAVDQEEQSQAGKRP